MGFLIEAKYLLNCKDEQNISKGVSINLRSADVIMPYMVCYI